MHANTTIPIAIRTHTKLEDSFQQRIREQLARRIGPALKVERATIRFEDANGPKGGIDTICRIKLVIASRPTIIVAKIASSVTLAFADAVQAIGTALSRTLKKQQQYA